MKISCISLVLIVFLLASCQVRDSNTLPINLGQEYYFQVNKSFKYFTPELSKKITFYKNGTYSRTEDTCTPLYIPNSKGIWITKLIGEWSFNGESFILTDKEILEFECKDSFTGEIVDCDMTIEQIPLGASEWFNGFILDSKTDEYLLITNLVNRSN